MLPKKYRLPLRTEFNRIKKEGKLIQGSLFGLLVAPQISNGIETDINQASRFAFIISNKVSKKAVIRNRLRRWLSEVIWSLKNETKKNFDGVFLVKKLMTEVNYFQVKEEVRLILQKAKLIS
ncbi:MAG: ribonuclease P protein component [Candidatus Shapirobacteria bacterium]|nr:ribonuclease P protein component [Candidatus Shapirobacteria bacterium]